MRSGQERDLEQRPEGKEQAKQGSVGRAFQAEGTSGASQAVICGKGIPGRGNSACKGPGGSTCRTVKGPMKLQSSGRGADLF